MRSAKDATGACSTTDGSPAPVRTPASGRCDTTGRNRPVAIARTVSRTRRSIFSLAATSSTTSRTIRIPPPNGTRPRRQTAGTGGSRCWQRRAHSIAALSGPTRRRGIPRSWPSSPRSATTIRCGSASRWRPRATCASTPSARAAAGTWPTTDGLRMPGPAGACGR